MYKSFGITKALKGVSFDVKPGEIKGLIGENGSGKSTVSSIIAGIQPATSGEMFFKGEPWKPSSMLDAQSKGIGMIVQEAGTISNITVAENIFLGHEKLFKNGPFINNAKMVNTAGELLNELGISSIKPYERVHKYNLQDRKLIEIAKALYWKPELFIVDETTTALSQTGRELLYKLMHKLKSEGKSVLFISHDLEELMEQCDSLTILRDGVLVGTVEHGDYDSNKIKSMMVGREMVGDYYHNDLDGYDDEVVLKADCITTMRDLLCFNLELHKGEILGIGGLSHCGMHTLGKALFGAEKVIDGEVTVGKSKTVVNNPKTAIKHRMGYISKDRDSESLCLSTPILDNIASTGYTKNRLAGPIISFKKEKKYVDEQVKALSLKCASVYHEASTLSGGNKQKVVFGKWMTMDAEILILDCPTRGVDIGVKASMYKLIYDMKKSGKSIVFISEELPELIGMSDRIIIMKDGEITHSVKLTDGFSEHDLIQHMI